MSENPPENPLLGYATPDTPFISKARRTAARIAIVLGSLMLLGGTCIGSGSLIAAAFFAASAKSGGSMESWIAFFVGFVGAVVSVFLLALGGTYLMGGIRIGRGSRKWATAIFVVAICHEAFLVLGVMGAAVSMLQEHSNILGFIIELLFALAVGQLILNLHRTRKETVLES